MDGGGGRIRWGRKLGVGLLEGGWDCGNPRVKLIVSWSDLCALGRSSILASWRKEGVCSVEAHITLPQWDCKVLSRSFG